jgi:transposase
MLCTETNNTNSLLDDVAGLQALVREQQSTIATLRSELQIEKLGRERAELKVKDLLRRMFGPSSEKLNAAQGLLFGAASAAEQAAAVARAAIKRASGAIKKVHRGGGRRPTPEHLPILDTVRIDLPEEQKQGLVWIRDEVSYEQDYQPSQFFRRVFIRPVYVHPKKEHGPLIAPMPARVIPQSRVGPGFLAHMLTGKYVDHIPYYRQARIDLRGGLDISDKARVRYTQACALLLLTIYHQLIERILRSGYVSADETVVKLLDPDRRHKARDAWLWVYLGPTVDAIVFQFSLSRSAENPERFFPLDWAGQLQCDGYGAYGSVVRTRPGMVILGCWTHARRRAVDALKSRAGEKALALVEEINELYAIEAEAKVRGYSAPQRAYYRYAKCRPVFKRLKARFEALKQSELPSSHLGDAARYALNRWPELVRYAKPGYGHVNIDQNPIEGHIRPTKLGAKNWLHIGHPKAGWRSAVIYSIVGTCRLLRIDPQVYLTWVLPKLAAATNKTAIGLLPHDYAREHPPDILKTNTS